jgi:hypothetical protein
MGRLVFYASALFGIAETCELTFKFLLANVDQAEAAVCDMSWTDSAMSDG